VIPGPAHAAGGPGRELPLAQRPGRRLSLRRPGARRERRGPGRAGRRGLSGEAEWAYKGDPHTHIAPTSVHSERSL